mmetsp:Transcript_4240/g.5596  ORF Transcript_4240/g.5596 Transcript_4240/m.5596 type:complete len:439 (+) Transcript_4240:161-1477(+)
MAFAAAHAKRIVAKKKEQELEMMLLAEKTAGNDMLSKFDMDDTGELNHIELKHMMQFMNNDIEPSEEEINKIFIESNSRGMECLDVAEVIEAMLLWEGICQDNNVINKLFKDFDIRDQGILDKIQVKECLLELTGKAPNNNELNNLFNHIHIVDETSINKKNLKDLIEAWFLECNPKEAAAIEIKDAKAKSERQKRASKIRYLDEKERAEKWVSQFNKDKSGFLTKEELGEMMKYMNNNKQPNQLEINRIFKQANIRYSNTLNFQEAIIAVSIWKSIIDEMNYILNIFNKYDINDNGLLEFNELKLCLNELYNTNSISDKQISDLILKINQDGSGTVSLEELTPAIEQNWFSKEIESFGHVNNLMNKTTSKSKSSSSLTTRKSKLIQVVPKQQENQSDVVSQETKSDDNGGGGGGEKKEVSQEYDESQRDKSSTCHIM